MELFDTIDTLSYLITNFVSMMDCIEVACIEVTHHGRSSSSSNGISGDPYSDMGVCNTSLSFDKQQQSEVCPEMFLYAEGPSFRTSSNFKFYLGSWAIRSQETGVCLSLTVQFIYFSYSHCSSSD